MSFYRGRINKGSGLFKSFPSNGEYIKKITPGIGEYFYKKHKFSGDSGLKQLSAQAWRDKLDEDDLLEYGSATYNASLPGDIIRRFFYFQFYNNVVTHPLLDLISIRRDHEAPFSDRNESKIKLDPAKRLPLGLRLADVFARWFDIYDLGWLKTLWNTYSDTGLSEIHRTYDIIFVHIVNRVAKVNPELMNFRTGDYDEILRCMRAIHAFAVLTDDVYDLYEKELIEPIRDRYEEILSAYMEEDDIPHYGLWDTVYYEGYTNLLEYVNLLIGDQTRASDTRQLSMPLITDICHLLKYIDINKGSYYRLERMLNRVDKVEKESPSYDNNIPTTRSERKKRRVGPIITTDRVYNYKGSWVDPQDDMYVVYDALRRKYKTMFFTKNTIEITTIERVSERYSLDFIERDDDGVGMTDTIKTILEDRRFNTLMKEVSKSDNTLNMLVNGNVEPVECKFASITMGEDDSVLESVNLELTVSDKYYLDDAMVFYIYVYNTLTNKNIPTAATLETLRDGPFSKPVPLKVKDVIDGYMQKHHGLGVISEKYTVEDYLLICLSDLYERDVPKFLDIYLQNRRDGYEIAENIKAILILLTSPAVSKYVYRKLMGDLLTDEDAIQYAGRAEVVTELSGVVKGNRELGFVNRYIKQGIYRASPYNVFKTDLEYLLSVLADE
ncbi:ORF85 [Ostreid herpesvirus 1]|nr:ORF85 [Ostreid herpesvirus 1]ASK05739.1 ORF85 [Ostreid herpesvirus 1]AVL27011.1 ORF85 [Ostreid herpesvirus 1]